VRHLWFARSSSRTRRQRHAREDLLEQWRWHVAEQALGGGDAIGAADVKVVHGGERGELAIAQAMAAMVMELELAVAALDRGAGALEQIGTVAGKSAARAMPASCCQMPSKRGARRSGGCASARSRS